MSMLSALDETVVRSRSSSSPARLGFLGVGWIGYNRMISIKASGFGDVVAIAEPSEELLTKVSAEIPSAQCFRSLEDLLALDLDGIVIATPSALHSAQAQAALRAGLAVFCQKPLGRNLAEAEAVVFAAQGANRLLGVDLSYRFTDALQKIRSALQSGDLGEIFAANVVFHNAYGPQKPWFYDPKQAGGGCVVDLGIHLVDAALWLLDSPVVNVRSRLFHKGSRLTGRDDVCEDYATAQLDFANGAVCQLECSWNLHAGQDAVIEFAFHGTKGGVSLRNVNGSFLDFTAESFRGTSREVLCTPPDEWGGRAAVEWAQQLALGRKYDPAIEHILEVTRVLDLIYERAGQP